MYVLVSIFEDRQAAFVKAQEWGEKIPTGIIYQQARPLYEEQLPQLKEGPLVKQEINPLRFEELLDEFI